jgi:hypothetical protein
MAAEAARKAHDVQSRTTLPVSFGSIYATLAHISIEPEEE